MCDDAYILSALQKFVIFIVLVIYTTVIVSTDDNKRKGFMCVMMGLYLLTIHMLVRSN